MENRGGINLDFNRERLNLFSSHLTLVKNLLKGFRTNTDIKNKRSKTILPIFGAQ